MVWILFNVRENVNTSLPRMVKEIQKMWPYFHSKLSFRQYLLSVLSGQQLS